MLIPSNKHFWKNSKNFSVMIVIWGKMPKFEWNNLNSRKVCNTFSTPRVVFVYSRSVFFIPEATVIPRFFVQFKKTLAKLSFLYVLSFIDRGSTLQKCQQSFKLLNLTIYMTLTNSRGAVEFRQFCNVSQRLGELHSPNNLKTPCSIRYWLSHLFQNSLNEILCSSHASLSGYWAWFPGRCFLTCGIYFQNNLLMDKCSFNKTICHQIIKDYCCSSAISFSPI